MASPTILAAPAHRQHHARTHSQPARGVSASRGTPTRATNESFMAERQPPTADPYARVTQRILAQLEQGVRPWTKPWSSQTLEQRVSRPLRSTGEPYRGINVLLLWMEAVAASYAAPVWLTYRQAQARGGQVRKGERGSPVVYFGRATRSAESGPAALAEPATTDTPPEIRFLKTYTVFNVAQIDGLPDDAMPAAVNAPAQPAPERIANADAFFAATGLALRHGGAHAYYSCSEDRIQLPPFDAFHDAESYYATLAHEAVHATRHPTRLDRDLGRQRFGDAGYAREELVAELGSAFLAADLGLYLEPRADHAAYLASWIEVLQADKRAIFSAAAHAERAVCFLHDLQPATGSPA
jgi:antirestriction protein ArdC